MNTSNALNGKIALITGASRGIGLAIAKNLANMGASVCLCARDEKKLKSAAGKVERVGTKVLAVPADVSRASDVATLVQQTERSLGPIEILVNNAGIGYFSPTHEASEEHWDAVLDTNLKSVSC
jgi:NAD(P)-dependent dehydrogenase (short-subunit alcohol dehydrogenase family)